MAKKKKKKSITYRIWVEARKGSDYAYSIRGRKRAAKKIMRLHKKGRLSDIKIATGRSLLKERKLTRPEYNKLKKEMIKFTKRRRR